MPDDLNEQEKQWKIFIAETEIREECPYSGLKFAECKSFLCDCFDYPQYGESQK